jgi:hypothetical protein
MKTMARGDRSLLAFFFLLGLAGCGPDDPEYDFDRADMEAEVFGTWSGSLELEGELAQAYTLDIRARDEPSRSLACGERRFSSDGESSRSLACMQSTTLEISATLTMADGSDSADLDGSFYVYGRTLGAGGLELQYRNVDRYLTVEQQNDMWRFCRLYAGSPSLGVGTCTLDARTE